MVEGLIITSDKSLFEDLSINFSNERNNFEYAESSESAKSVIELELPDYIVIIDKNIKQVQNILNDVTEDEQIKRIPVLCFLSSKNWSQRDILWNAGVKDIIRLPIAKDELYFHLERFIDDISDLALDQEEIGMHGKLDDYNLLDLIQTLESNKKTGVLILYHARDEGKIWFSQGNIHDAKYRTLKPLQAILKMISWMEGDFSIAFVDEAYEKIIEQDNQAILLEAIQHIDQRNKILAELPDLHENLLISPEADMEKMKEQDVTYLRFFHGGQTIASYIEAFDTDDLTLLEKVRMFIQDSLLMTREEFDSHRTEQELEVEQAGIKKVFSKIFKRKDDQSVIEKQKETDTEDTLSLDENASSEETLYANYFNKEKMNLQKLKKMIEKI